MQEYKPTRKDLDRFGGGIQQNPVKHEMKFFGKIVKLTIFV